MYGKDGIRDLSQITRVDDELRKGMNVEPRHSCRELDCKQESYVD
jgi:hypothetical protein